jgi:hypothetical protein
MNLIIIVILTAVLQVFAPWWVVAIVPFVILFWRPASPSRSFWTGFAGTALPWLGYGFYLHYISDGILSDRVAGIFFLPNGILLLAVTVLIGGLVGGFSALAGFWTRQLFRAEPVAYSSQR